MCREALLGRSEPLEIGWAGSWTSGPDRSSTFPLGRVGLWSHSSRGQGRREAGIHTLLNEKVKGVDRK